MEWEKLDSLKWTNWTPASSIARTGLPTTILGKVFLAVSLHLLAQDKNQTSEVPSHAPLTSIPLAQSYLTSSVTSDQDLGHICSIDSYFHEMVIRGFGVSHSTSFLQHKDPQSSHWMPWSHKEPCEQWSLNGSRWGEQKSATWGNFVGLTSPLPSSCSYSC